MNRSRLRVWAMTAALGGAIALAVSSLMKSPLPPPPFVMVRTLAPRAVHGRVAVVPLAASVSRRYVTPLSCVRVHFAAGAGICVVEEARDRSVVHAAYTFDRHFVRRHRIELNGIPVRVRMSPNGRLAAITVYGEEESPAGERLATETILVEVASGRTLADLRDFALSGGGAAVTPPIDIASATFAADSDRFYASLVSGTERYLVTGSVQQRALAIVRPGIANEALSSDGKRLIAKRRIGERGFWQITVIDLETWEERALNQGSRSVDDQVDWFDAAHVTYHDVTEAGTGVWKLSIDGATGPELVVPDAFSPSVQR